MLYWLVFFILLSSCFPSPIFSCIISTLLCRCLYISAPAFSPSLTYMYICVYVCVCKWQCTCIPLFPVPGSRTCEIVIGLRGIVLSICNSFFIVIVFARILQRNRTKRMCIYLYLYLYLCLCLYLYLYPYLCLYISIVIKKLTHRIMEGDKSKICKADNQGTCYCSFHPKAHRLETLENQCSSSNLKVML